MRLSQDQVRRYERNGFLELPSLFSGEEIRVLDKAFERDCRETGPYVIRENEGERVRAIYGSHMRQPEFDLLTKMPRTLGVSRQLIDCDFYVYQFKINTKCPLGGESWAWHHDYAVWKTVDDLPAPRQVNVALFLDEMSEFNGPVIFIPGSHIGRATPSREEKNRSTHVDPEGYAPPTSELEALVARNGMVSPKGPPGTVVLFHSEVLHGSSTNMAPKSRRLLIITYNDVNNVPRAPTPDRNTSSDGRASR